MKFFWLIIFVGLSTGWAASQASCPAVVTAALTSVGDNCAATGRNQACYGNPAVSAQGRTDDVTFLAVGDIADLNDIEMLTMAPFVEESGEWGIALLRLQASLPDTLPGENISVLAFGDVALENAVPRIEPVTATLTGNGRARIQPLATGDVGVINAVPAGTVVEVIGRNEAQDWLYVKLGQYRRSSQENGWISTQVLRVEGNAAALPVIPSSDSLAEAVEVPPAPVPMSAFYLRSGITASPCAQVPPSGLLVQSPLGGQAVTFSLNEVRVSMGSTLFFANGPQKTLDIYVLEGVAAVEALDTLRIVPAGTWVSVPLAEDGRRPVDVPGEPAPYDAAYVASLPVGLLGPVAIAPPLPAENVQGTIAWEYARSGLLEGAYQYVNTIRCTSPSQGVFAENTYQGTISIMPTEAAITIVNDVFTRGGDGRYYFISSFTTPTGITANGTQMYDAVSSMLILTINSVSQFTITVDTKMNVPLYGDVRDGVSYATGATEDRQCAGTTVYNWIGF
jgi:hypothetical protein